MSKIRTSFAMVPGWVITRVPDPISLRVYVHLAWKYADAERHAFPKESALAEELNMGQRTVQRAIATLREADAIKIERSRKVGGHYGRNEYSLPLDDPRDGTSHPPTEAAGLDQGKLDDLAGRNHPPAEADRQPPSEADREPDPSLGSKSFSRDLSLEDELRARDVDRPLVEAGLKPGQEQSADCEEVEGLWGQDQALFAGDQLGSSTAKASAERDAEFEEFWAAYPRREKRADARRAWDKAIKKVGVATVMAGVARYVRHLAWWHPDSLDRNKHTAHPSSWLNGERWNDELPPEPTGQRKVSTNGHSSGYKPYTNPVDDSVYHEEIR